MKHYVGLDVSMEATAVCVVDGAGEIVAERKVASDPRAIGGCLAPWLGSMERVGLEAGSLSSWLYHGLHEQGIAAICIETRRMKAYARASAVKTDRRDARLIAQAMRAGLYRAVYVKSEASQKLRLALSARQLALRQARQLQNMVRGALKPFGIRLGKVGSGGFAARVREVLADRPDLWALVAPLLAARAALLDEVRGYDRLLRRFAREDAVCRQLMTVPGIGVLNAVAYRAVIETPHRFRCARDVAVALGLTPRIDQSGESARCGAITRAGDGLLRSLLFEAANAVLTRCRRPGTLQRWGLAVARRRGMNRARVAVARRLAIILFCMWRDGTSFRFEAGAAAA